MSRKEIIFINSQLAHITARMRGISTRIRTGKYFREISVQGGFGKEIGRRIEVTYNKYSRDKYEQTKEKRNKEEAEELWMEYVINESDRNSVLLCIIYHVPI
jgi:hypothetical protein